MATLTLSEPVRRFTGHAVVVAPVVACLCLLLIPLFAGHPPLDLRVYLAGARAVVRGQPLYGSAVKVQGYGFTYPPFAAAMFAPLAALALPVAIAVMAATSLCCLAYVVHVVRHSGRAFRASATRGTPVILACLILLSEPIRLTIWNGQVNLWLLALILTDVRTPATKPWRGIAVGLAAAIKLTPLIFVFGFAAARDWRAARTTLVTFTAASLLAAVISPSDSRAYWTHDIFNSANLGDTSRLGNQSLFGVAERFTSNGHVARLVWLVMSLIAVGVYLLVVRALRGADVESTLLQWCATAVLGLLISPVSWTHHWVWWLPLAWAIWTQLPRIRRAALPILVVTFGIGCNKVPFSWTFGWAPARVVIGNLYVWEGLAFFFALLWSVTATPDRRRRSLLS